MPQDEKIFINRNGVIIMRKFNITVNGNSYEVEVEEIGGASYVPTAPITPVQAAPVQAAPAQTVSAPKAADAAPEPTPNAPKSAGKGSVKITAPMPGTVLDIPVKVGDSIEEGQAVVILEAMKMENDIVSPSAGTVASIEVTKGASVNSGDVLVTLN